MGWGPVPAGDATSAAMPSCLLSLPLLTPAPPRLISLPCWLVALLPAAGARPAARRHMSPALRRAVAALLLRLAGKAQFAKARLCEAMRSAGSCVTWQPVAWHRQAQQLQSVQS